MKQRVRNVIIILFFLTGIPYLRFLCLRRKGPVVRTLVMHDVTDANAFIRFLDWVSEKYHVTSPHDFRAGNLDSKKLNILLTFDDGYESWEKVVVPELEKRNLSAYFFVTSGFLDTYGDKQVETEFCNNNLKISHHKPLSWNGLKRIVQSPACVIGGHTIAHPNLKQLDDNNLKNEIVDNKQKLEDVLGHGLEVFAYPFGQPKIHVDGRVQQVVKEAGYVHGFTTEIAFTDRVNKPFAVPRVCTEYSWKGFFSTAWLLGSYDLIKKVYE
jgi:peptidoglycan/xylan/chitin deacetylase (PgdA/CDA1 family)